MKTVVAKIRSTSPISFSRYYAQEVPKQARETDQDYEDRTWRNRVHARPDGTIYIPPFAFKNCLDNAAKYLSKQIPGKGKSTYTKHFVSGVMVREPLLLKVKKDQVRGEWRHVPADGQPGGAKRVLKCFPVIPEFGGEVAFTVLDDIITLDILKEHLDVAGRLLGSVPFGHKTVASMGGSWWKRFTYSNRRRPRLRDVIATNNGRGLEEVSMRHLCPRSKSMALLIQSSGTQTSTASTDIRAAAGSSQE